VRLPAVAFEGACPRLHLPALPPDPSPAAPPLSLPSPSADGATYTLQSMNAEYLTQVICSSELPQPREFTLRHRAM
jgi:hypothetical protein